MSHPAPAKPRRRVLGLALGAAGLGAAGLAGWQLFGSAERAPAVTYPLIDGRRVADAELRGKVVLVNFWATSCVTCVAEMPRIADTHRKFAARGFETIAVAMGYDRPDFVLQFAESRKLPFAVAYDRDGKVAEGWGRVAVTPTSMLVGPDGTVLKRWIGEPHWDSLHALIDAKLPRA